MSGVKLKMDVELDALNRNVAALAAMTKKTASAAVRDTAVMVLQAGANLTPAAGDLMKSRGAAMARRGKRDIISVVRRYRHGIEELVQGARPEAPGDKQLWMIPRPSRRRPISKSGDRRFWVFETAAAAREHQPITFRGIGKAGFWAQLPALGKPIPGKYAKTGYLADVPGIKETTGDLNRMIPVVTVRNRSVSIQRRAESLTTLILSKANNRIAGMARSSEQRLAAFKAAGGVVWQQAGTVNGESFGEYTEVE